MSTIWKQKAEGREDARDTRLIAEGIARKAAKAAAEAAKTPKQIDIAWCQHTEEHARSPAFYAAEDRRWKRLYAEWDEARRIREGGHPKVDLSKGFPPLGCKK